MVRIMYCNTCDEENEVKVVDTVAKSNPTYQGKRIIDFHCKKCGNKVGDTLSYYEG
jgi:hypothetical protein